MKGVIELNWKILVGIIAAIIAIILIYLVIAGILNPDNLSKGAAELCKQILSKVKEDWKGFCDSFWRG